MGNPCTSDPSTPAQARAAAANNVTLRQPRHVGRRTAGAARSVILAEARRLMKAGVCRSCARIILRYGRLPLRSWDWPDNVEPPPKPPTPEFEVPCTSCSAAVGEPCISRTMRRLRPCHIHAARREALEVSKVKPGAATP